MIASLPMYATPLTAEADKRFWALIRDHLRQMGIAAPDGLTRMPADLVGHWRDPHLLLSQTCGLPYRAVLKEHVTYVGTPDYAVNDCPPGHYRSVVIARADDTRQTLADFRTARLAYNEPLSQSGWAALALETPEVLQGPRHRTGSHLNSVRAVRENRADFAAVDAVTWRHLVEAGQDTGLHVVHTTRPTPGLPLITAKDGPAPALLAAVSEAIDRLETEDRARLHLRGIVAFPPSAYDLPIPPSPAALD